MNPIHSYIPKSVPVKAFQISDGSWVILNADATEWESVTDAVFQATYTLVP